MVSSSTRSSATRHVWDGRRRHGEPNSPWLWLLPACRSPSGVQAPMAANVWHCRRLSSRRSRSWRGRCPTKLLPATAVTKASVPEAKRRPQGGAQWQCGVSGLWGRRRDGLRAGGIGSDSLVLTEPIGEHSTGAPGGVECPTNLYALTPRWGTGQTGFRAGVVTGSGWSHRLRAAQPPGTFGMGGADTENPTPRGCGSCPHAVRLQVSRPPWPLTFGIADACRPGDLSAVALAKAEAGVGAAVAPLMSLT